LVAVAVVALCCLLLLLILVYIASVCRFILFEAVLTRRVALRAGWSKWQPQAARLFVFQFALFAATLAILAIFVWLFVLAYFGGTFGAMREHVARSALGIAGAVVILIVLFAGLAIVNVFTKDFVVPQMALEN